MKMTDDEWMALVASDDPADRIKALHAACPCTGFTERYEAYQDTLYRLKKDPDPRVRATALHLDVDALEHMRVADEVANGYDANPPGGHGKQRQTRRAHVRQGWSVPTCDEPGGKLNDRAGGQRRRS
jgi:hypothetical protein